MPRLDGTGPNGDSKTFGHRNGICKRNRTLRNDNQNNFGCGLGLGLGLRRRRRRFGKNNEI